MPLSSSATPAVRRTRRTLRGLYTFTLAAAVLGLSAPRIFAHGEEAATLTVHPLHAGIYMLEGNGGNIGLLTGAQGTLMIDDQYPQESGAVTAAVKAISDQPITFLLNTHWHGDHTGGNPHFGREGALIVAHDNVRQRLQSGGEIAAFAMTVPPAVPEALPVVTFSDSMGLHWNGQTIDLIHPAPAHTDGDTVVYLREANVVHTGDLYFNGLYPFIDASSGGSVRGMVSGVDAILARIDDKTRIIPGHGPLSDKAGLVAYRTMLATVMERVAALKTAGKTRDQVIAAKPTADFDADWGGGFLKPDVWVGIVFDTLPAR
jgi:glyoxylase-like metal-dependent hydrolase (beta-lactamase superfamily II)